MHTSNGNFDDIVCYVHGAVFFRLILNFPCAVCMQFFLHSRSLSIRNFIDEFLHCIWPFTKYDNFRFSILRPSWMQKQKIQKIKYTLKWLYAHKIFDTSWNLWCKCKSSLWCLHYIRCYFVTSNDQFNLKIHSVQCARFFFALSHSRSISLDVVVSCVFALFLVIVFFVHWALFLRSCIVFVISSSLLPFLSILFCYCLYLWRVWRVSAFFFALFRTFVVVYVVFR